MKLYTTLLLSLLGLNMAAQSALAENQLPVISFAGSGLDTGYVAQSLSRQVTLEVTDDGTIDSVKLFQYIYNDPVLGNAMGTYDTLPSILLGTEMSAPYQFDIQLEKVGTYVFIARAWDDASAMAENWAVVQLFDSINDPKAQGRIENDAKNGWFITGDITFSYGDMIYFGDRAWNDPNFSGITSMVMYTPAASCKKIFYGDGIEIHGYKDQSGLAHGTSITIDNYVSIVDTSILSEEDHQNNLQSELATINNLPLGFHVLKLQRLGDWSVIDYIRTHGPGTSAASLEGADTLTGRFFVEPLYLDTIKINAEDPDGIKSLKFQLNNLTPKDISMNGLPPYDFKYGAATANGVNTFNAIITDIYGNNDKITLASFYVNWAPIINLYKGFDKLIILDPDSTVVSDYALGAMGKDEDAKEGELRSAEIHWLRYNPDQDSLLIRNTVLGASVKTDLPGGTHVFKVIMCDEPGACGTRWGLVQVKSDSSQSGTFENNAEEWMINCEGVLADCLDADSWNTVTNSARAGVKVIRLTGDSYAKCLFRGKNLQIVGTKQPSMGSLQVRINGSLLKTVDCNEEAGNASTEAVLFTKTYPTDKTYLLELSSANGELVEINYILVDQIEVGPTAIPVIKNSPFSVYPNPVNDILYFDTDRSAVLYNLQGVAVRSVTDASSMNVEGLAKGIYLLRSGERCVKVVVQ